MELKNALIGGLGHAKHLILNEMIPKTVQKLSLY